MQLITRDYSEIAGDKSRLESRMMAHLNPQPGQKILDAGCGDGRLTVKIAALCPEAVIDGIEIDSALAAQAQAKGLKVEVLPVQDLWMQQERYSRYDKVFCNLVLNWLKEGDDFESAILGFSQVLKPGGSLVAVFPLQLNPQIRQEIRDALMPYVQQSQELKAWALLAAPGAEDSKLGRTEIDLLACDALLKEVLPIRHTSKYELLAALKDSDFVLHEAEMFHQRSPLPQGLEAWLKGFILPHVFKALELSEADQTKCTADIAARLKQPNLGLYLDGQWSIVADMISFTAVRRKV